MRGKVPLCQMFTKFHGITPAYAGKSFSNVTGFFKEQDHPRLCGEKIKPRFSDISEWGSPPPMRGKVHTAAFADSFQRITPAYAGKRCEMPSTAFLYLGSPPPMRGKVPHSFVHHLSTRITPAYAGKSCRNHGGT